MLGEPVQQTVGGVQLREVAVRVHDGHDRVEAAVRVAACRHVVGVPLPRSVGRLVVGGEGQPGPYRVTGVVDGEHRRPGSGGEEDAPLGAALLLGQEAVQRLGHPQRRVHQLLVAEDEDAAGAVQMLRDTGRHVRQGGFQPGAMRRGEAVPAAVGQSGGPAEVDPYDVRTATAGRRRLLCRAGLLGGDEFLAAGQDVRGQLDAARGQRHEVDAGAQVRRELLQVAAVRVGAHVDQGDDHVPLTREPRMQRLDRVQDGPAGGELVVDEHQRPVPGQECAVLREQQMRGGVAVLLLEPAHLRHARHRSAGGVQIRREGQAVGHRMSQAGGGLGVAQDDGPGGGLVTQQLAHPAPQPDAGPMDHSGPLGHMLAEHVRHEQMGPLGVAAQRQPQQFRQLVPAAQRDAEPPGDPFSRPDHAFRLLRRTVRLVHRGPGPRQVTAGLARDRCTAGQVCGRLAVSSSTNPMPSRATPNASARSRVRSAQARCGFTSFILFV